MVHEDIIKKRKAKQAKKRDTEGEAGSPTVDKISDGKGDIAPPPKKSTVEAPIEPVAIPKKRSPPKLIDDPENPIVPIAPNNFVLLEEIQFVNGKNILSMQYYEKNNRQRCIKVYLNDEHEIRPVTYNGAGTGHAFWQLLKGAMKK